MIACDRYDRWKKRSVIVSIIWKTALFSDRNHHSDYCINDRWNRLEFYRLPDVFPTDCIDGNDHKETSLIAAIRVATQWRSLHHTDHRSQCRAIVAITAILAINLPECTASYTYSIMAANSKADFMDELQQYDCLYSNFELLLPCIN